MIAPRTLTNLLALGLLPTDGTSAQTIDLRAACTVAGIGSAITALNSAVDVNFVQYVSAGVNLSFPNDPTTQTCTQYAFTTTVDFCRIAMLVTTSSTSNVTVESWLPQKWTGRYLSTGNGGLNGCNYYISA